MEDIITIFDSIKRCVLIEKAPFLVEVNPLYRFLCNTNTHYMVRKFSKSDCDNAIKADLDNDVINKFDKLDKDNFYMIVDLGTLKNASIINGDYIGCRIGKKDVKVLGGFNKLNK